MKKENLWQKYSELDDQKAERRMTKKRKRMPVEGRQVFEILKMKKKGNKDVSI